MRGLLFLVFVGAWIIPLSMWLEHPELTKMEMALQYWPWYLTGAVSFAILKILPKKKKNDSNT